ncbi:acyltransferase [Vibrio parahaemolyticus]|nr:acyltransferase [Vibrio parahaemolyticus]
MKFRTDINGLRAIAVIAVVLFHFNPAWVPGGFAGVDVFFVISGFLMTGIIFRGLENHNFSIINFYIARANRIIPALSVVCLVLLAFGWFYLAPLDYRVLGKHVASSLGFISNVVYWRESGYFDSASHSKWLLHTWSLSVEWQFYIIYPVLLVLLKKCLSLTKIKRLLVVSTVFGFIFSAYVTYRWPDPAYFLFPTRAWEMMMGGLAFIYPLQNVKKTHKKYLEWAGIMLILSSYWFISKDNLWPGYLALIPVMGAYLVIIAHRSDSEITNNIIMQKVGSWSYSIYLWHWPIVVLGYYLEVPHWEWIGIPVSVILGFCSYKFIEGIKLPTLSSMSVKSIASFKPLWMVAVVGLMSTFVYAKHGIPTRVSADVLKTENLSKGAKKELEGCFYFPNDDYDGKPCIIGNKANISAVIIGDSHALSLSESLLDQFDLKKEGVVGYYRASCPFILNVKNKSHHNFNCTKSNKLHIQEIMSKYKGVPVYIINRTSGYIYGFHSPDTPEVYFDHDYKTVSKPFLNEFSKYYEQTMCSIAKNNPVYITTPTPEMPFNIPKEMAKKEMLNNRPYEYDLDVKKYNTRNAFIRGLMDKVHQKCGVTILNVGPYFCNSEKCISSINGDSLYYDDNHLSVFGSRLLSPLFKSTRSNAPLNNNVL